MQNNLFKARLLAREQQLGIWSMLSNANVLEVLTQSAYDWVMIDTEHAPNEVPMVIEQLRAVAQGLMPAVVRPRTNDSVVIKRLLDVGAQTLLVPMVDTAFDARRAVNAMRYPSAGGQRGVSAASRANRYGRDTDYFDRVHEELCLLVQIETVTALANIEDIAAVDGIDALFIGPSDLAAAMGHLGNARHPDVQAAIGEALQRCHTAGKPMGILMTDLALAGRYVEMGFDFVAAVTDIGLLRSGAEAVLAQMTAKKRST